MTKKSEQKNSSTKKGIETVQSRLNSSEEKSEEKKSKWDDFLHPHKIIRDAVHGDIEITKLETKLIDTEIFQRLHGIKQLGPTYLVYPDAKHTRFEHSLGVLYVAQKIINAVEKNCKYKENILKEEFIKKLSISKHQLFSPSSRDKVLIRLTALLHDAAHLPFGHTLEKEGNLFKRSQWADLDRFQYFFENGFSKIIKQFLKKREIEDGDISEFIEDLGKTLQAIEGVDPKSSDDEFAKDEDEAIRKLRWSYVGDIVGNTICADLFDYIMRDSYFTGFKLTYDPRIIENFVIIGKTKKDARLALLGIRKNIKRHDTISSALNLLQQRYYLTETVHHHDVKKSASAMVINAVFAALNKAHLISKKDLYDLTEDELLYKLITETKKPKDRDQELISNTLQNLRARKIYKPVYKKYYQKDEDRIKKLVEDYKDPERRYKLQEKLEINHHLPPGSIIIYASKQEKGKEALAKCVWVEREVGEIKRLEEVNESKKQVEIINKKYEKLWTLYVFMDREKISECPFSNHQHQTYGKLVAGRCKKVFGPLNDMEDPELRNVSDINDSVKELEEIYIQERHKNTQLDQDKKSELINITKEFLKNPELAETRYSKLEKRPEKLEIDDIFDLGWKIVVE